jgi:membrane protein implicated in regulation of membrane protease activity
MVDAGVITGIVLIVIGIALFVGEIVHPGVFLIIPGTVIVVSGIMYTLVPDFLFGTVAGPAIVLAGALVATVVSIKYYQYIAPVHPPMVTNPNTLIGSEGVVIAPVVPDSLHGKVQVRSEVWSARSNVPIPKGSRVRIVGGSGVSVEVVPVPSPGPSVT